MFAGRFGGSRDRLGRFRLGNGNIMSTKSGYYIIYIIYILYILYLYIIYYIYIIIIIISIIIIDRSKGLKLVNFLSHIGTDE